MSSQPQAKISSVLFYCVLLLVLLLLLHQIKIHLNKIQGNELSQITVAPCYQGSSR